MLSSNFEQIRIAFTYLEKIRESLEYVSLDLDAVEQVHSEHDLRQYSLLYSQYLGCIRASAEDILKSLEYLSNAPDATKT